MALEWRMSLGNRIRQHQWNAPVQGFMRNWEIPRSTAISFYAVNSISHAYRAYKKHPLNKRLLKKYIIIRKR